MPNRELFYEWAKKGLLCLVLVYATFAVTVMLAGGCKSAPPLPAQKPHLLIFHAEWCQDCPTRGQITELQNRYPNVDICDVDIDEHPEVKKEYHVTKVPTYLFCGQHGCWVSNSLDEVKGWLNEI